MNILILTPDYPPVYGGIGTHVYFLVKGLLKEGNRVTVVVNRLTLGKDSNRKIKKITEHNLTVIDIPDIYFSESAYTTMNYYNNIELDVACTVGNSSHTILEVLPSEQFDLIHIHDAYTAMLGVLLSRHLNIPLITTLHSMHADKTSIKYYLREYAVNNSDKVIAVSGFIKRKAMNNYVADIDKIAVIYNSINIKRIHMEKNPDICEITFCGRFEEIKGIMNLLEVFRDVLNSVKGQNNVVLNLIGDGSLKKQITDFVHEFNMEEHVKIYEKIENEEVLRIFSRSLFLVIPSKEEPFATVGLEAMSVKTAVIASDVGGMPEMILHGYNGYIYPVEDIKQLKKYIIDLIMERDQAIIFGENGYKRLMENFVWKKNIPKILEIYENTVENRNAEL